MTTPSRGCSTTASNPSFVNNKVQPLTLSASVSDADGGDINASFIVYKTSALTTSVWSHNKGNEATGTVTDTVPAGTLMDGSYAWRVLVGDRVLLSPYSGYCYFNVDNTDPALPTVSAGTGPYTVGAPTKVTFTSPASDNVAVFAYWWADSAKTSPSPTDPMTAVDKTTHLVTTLPGGGTASKQVHYASASGGSATVNVAPIDNASTLWVTAYDKAGNVSTDNAAAPSSAAGLEVDAGGDPSVSYSAGHGWIDDSADGVVQDRNTAAGLPLSIGAGLGETVYDSDQGVSAISFPGYVELTRTFDSSTGGYATVAEGAAPSGYASDTKLAPDGYLGQLLPVGSAAYDSTTMRALSDCALAAGGHVSTVYAATECPSTKGTATLEGYLWDAAADVPAGLTAVALYRCYADSHYFDTFNNTCDGTGVHASGFGYLARTGLAQTSAPAVDTTKSFTVSAWLKASTDTASKSQYYAAVSQSGASSYGYILDIYKGAFQFCVRSQVSVSAVNCAVDPAGGRAGSWNDVTGIFDAVSGDVRLIVDGDTVSAGAVVHHTIPQGETSASGPLMVGTAVLSNSLISQWDGQIASVSVFPGVIDSPQLRNLKNSGTP